MDFVHSASCSYDPKFAARSLGLLYTALLLPPSPTTPALKMGKAAVLPHNYPHLQNLIKRDPQSYSEEFAQQYQHFKASLAIVALRPSATDDHFEALVTFISHVANCYPESKAEFPGMVVGLLEQEAVSMNPSLRRTLVQCLQLLRKHGLVELLPLLELLFRLFRVQDKALREMLYTAIVGEVRRANKPHKNNSLNRSLQNFMYGLFEENTGSALGTEESLALDRILQIIIELYKKRIWDDARTVNVIADAVVKKPSAKVMNTALNFFVGRFRGKALQAEDTSDEEETNDYKDLQQKSSFNGANKRSTKKKLKKALNEMHKKEKRSQATDQHGSFAAIHLLHDPQGFVERLFGHLKKSNDPFDLKLLMMNVISRVIGAHKLLLLDFYSFLHRYIQPHQKEVTQILAYAAQATHDIVPGDVITPLVTAIAHNFAAEHCANEVIAAGLNGLREICSRCPAAMGTDLLQDLSNFKGYNNKGVVMAARSLISLYREIDPELLHRKDRGKEISMALKEGKIAKPKAYGANTTNYLDASHVDGVAELNGADGELSEDELSGDELSGEELSWEEFSGDGSSGEEPSDDESNDGELDDCEPGNVELPVQKKVDIISLSAQKIFGPEELSRLRKRVAGDMIEEEGSDSSSSESENDPDVVDPRSLESRKKAKADYEARMASIKAGREGRLKYGSKKGKHHEKASSTNRVKEKTTKNAIMLAHKGSVRAKKKRSLKEKQMSQTKHRKRQKMRR